MALPNLSGSSIQNTFQRIIHTDGTTFYNGTGSVVDLATVTQLNISSSTLQSNIDAVTVSLPTGLYSSSLQTLSTITASGDISTSGDIITNTLKLGEFDGNYYIARGSDGTLFYKASGGHYLYGGPVTASSTISASGAIFGANLSGVNTGDQTLSHLATINNLNASSSTLSNSIDTKLNKTSTGSFAILGANAEFNELTAHKYIISSSVSYLTQSFSSGSTEFGDTADDTHTFTGNITASGGISASGEVITNTLRLTPGANDYVGSNGTSVDIKSANAVINLIGNVTASGNISSSGTITGNSLVGTVGTATQGTIDHDSLANFVANEHIDHSGVSVIAGTGLTGGGTIAANRTLNVIGGTGVTANANDIAIGQDVATTANVSFNNITATGDISSSAGLVGQTLTIGGASIVQRSADGTTIRFGSSGDITKVQIGKVGNNESINLAGHITASGNISSSGTIVASNLSGTNTGDQDLSSYSTITQLNASSSTLQGNINEKQTIIGSEDLTIQQTDGLQAALDAKVDDSQVLTNVPANAVFTDTVYTHPANHAISVITGLQTALDSKQDSIGNGDLTIAMVNSLQTSLNGKVSGNRVLTDVPANAVFTDTVYTHPTNHAISVITGLQSALDAKQDLIGNEDLTILQTDGLQDALDAKVDDSQVLTNVPANAVFTDTVYTHPSNHAISVITGLQTALDSKQDGIGSEDLTIAMTDGLQDALNAKVDDSQVLTNVPANAVFTDTNTTYSVQDGELSQNNFTNADHTKLNNIEANATADQTQAEINALGITAVGIAGPTDGDVLISTDGSISVVLDNDNDEDNQYFEVRNSATGVVFLVTEDGNVTLDGTVDGRDVAADGTKLDNISVSADVTDATTVTAAGALMDSEVTNLAQVKAFASSDYATAAQGTKADTAHGWGNHGSAGYSTATGVENNADVTDTSNVESAGALMDSELTDLAGVKGVTVSTLQVKPSEGAFVNGDKTKLDGIAVGAEVNVQSDWNSTSGDNQILNKPTIPAAYVDADAVSAVAAADSYLKNDASDAIAGTLTILDSLFIERADGTNSTKTKIRNNTTTSNRTLTIPDATGTLALTSGDITGNAATATALTIGDKTIQGNLRIGGTGDVGNNWISIDAQSGNDSTGGGITFFETGTYDVDSPQYGAKIVYNETADEFAIGTMHNNVFMRQVYFSRQLARTYFNGDLQVRDSSPAITIVDTSTTVANGDVVGILNFTNEDDDGSTLRIQAVATEDHASGTNGGTKLEIKTTPNGSSAEAVALTVGEDKSLTIEGDTSVAGDLTVNGSVNKSFQQFNLSFADDIGSTQHYLSWRDQYEQSSISSDLTDTNYLVPANGRVKCVYIRVGSRVYSRTMTVRVYSQNAGFQQGQVLQEDEATSISSSDDFEVFAFYFDNAEHFQAGDSIKISVQDSADSGNTQIYHVTAVLEFDYTQMGRTTSGELA